MMTYSKAEQTKMKRGASEIIDFIGRACGLTYKEMEEIRDIIDEKAQELVAHVVDRESGLNPYRIAFLAIVSLRVQKHLWYKPGKTRRMMQIQKNYTNWWEHLDPDVGVARAYLPAMALAMT